MILILLALLAIGGFSCLLCSAAGALNEASLEMNRFGDYS